MDSKSIAKGLPWQNGVKLLRADASGILAVEKPVGVLSHPNRKSEMGKALMAAKSYDEAEKAYRLEGDHEMVYLLNRLDSATSGVLLLGLSTDVRDAVLKEFEAKRVEKVYEALVFGMPVKGNPLWRDRLSKDRTGGSVRAVAGNGNLAETRLLAAKPIPGVPLMSRLQLMPLTGRTHQLRIQTSKRRIPIVGDKTYGDFAKNKLVAKSKGLKRLCLHCVETRINLSLEGRKISFAASSKCPF